MRHQLKFYLVSVLTVSFLSSFGQNTDQSTFSANGSDVTSGIFTVSATIGQIINSTNTRNSIILTEGFYQTSPNIVLTSLQEEEQKISIFPNPSINSIRISGYDQNSTGSYQISSIDGKTFKHSTNIDFQSNQEIPVHDLSNGVYLLTISISNQKSRVFRIIKQ